MDRAATPDMVRLLWDVCQIPDFRKIMPDHHTSFLRQVYLHLAGEGGQLDETWVKTQIDRLTSTAGDIWARSTARSAAPVETVNPNLESSWPVEM